MGNILSTFIYFLAEAQPSELGFSSTEILGLTSAAAGLSMTLLVFPAGFFSDRFRRDYILKLASILGFVAISFTFFAETIDYIFIALLFWGGFQGLNRPSLESILADSVESGSRSLTYSLLHLLRQLAMAAGPFINVLLFVYLGDEWDIDILKQVMVIGIIISFLSLIVMMFFRDDKSLGSASESIESVNGFSYEQENEISIIPTRKHRFIPRINFRDPSILIPLVLVGSNVIIGTGAGMTIKYFPVFFWEIYKLQPISVQLIMGFTSIATGLASLIAQRFSVWRGRAIMIFIVQSLATLCLFVISFYPPIWILVPFFIARGALMNASQPLSRSILMDVVPKKHRGKINSLEAIAWGLFWNFSAVVGGFLIGSNNDFRLCFLVTTGLYVVGTLPILFLSPLISKERSSIK